MAKRKKTETPITGTIRFARQMPLAMRTLCIATPTHGALADDSGTQAQLDLVCCQPARMFDVERGGYMCDECGGALPLDEKGWPLPRDWQKAEAQNPFKDCGALRGTKRAMRALAWIEEEMCAYYFREFPNASAEEFKSAKPLMWEELGRTLTYQVRLSTAHVMGDSNN